MWSFPVNSYRNPFTLNFCPPASSAIALTASSCLFLALFKASLRPPQLGLARLPLSHDRGALFQ